jgi:hypothetical protein
VIIQSSGRDKGQLGAAPFDEMAEDLSRFAPIELFIDAGHVISAVVPAQDAWTDSPGYAWIHVLPLHLTA